MDTLRFSSALGICLFGSYQSKFVPSQTKRQMHYWQMFFSFIASIVAYGFLPTFALILFCLTTFFILHFPLSLVKVPDSYSRAVKSSLIWLLCFTWLSYLHLSRPPEAAVHVSGSVMLMVIKLTSFVTLSEDQDMKPNLIPFLGWLTFIPSFLVGPTLSFKEYNVWVTDIVEKGNTENRIRLKNIGGLTKFLIDEWAQLAIILFFGLNSLLIHYFPLSNVISPKTNAPWIDVFVSAWIALWSIRCKYYFVWTFSKLMYKQAGANLFVSHGGKNVDPLAVESATSIYAIMNNWNICTNDWLKRVVFEPTRNYTNSMIMAILTTNIVSAFWHGFAPGYYATFVLAGFATYLGKSLHKQVVPKLGDHKEFYEIFMFFWVMIVSVTFTLPFQVLTWEKTLACWASLNYAGHIVCLFTLIYLKFVA